MANHKMIYEIIILIAVVFCLAMIIFIRVSALQVAGNDTIIFNNETYKPTSMKDIISDCEGKNLVNTSKCLVEDISLIFNYTIRNETNYTGFDGTFNDVLKIGGDCYDWTNIYKQIAYELGFEAKANPFFYENENVSGHTFLTIYDETGYCILDQTLKPKCVLFGDKK